jgi:hypothetical protein
MEGCFEILGQGIRHFDPAPIGMREGQPVGVQEGPGQAQAPGQVRDSSVEAVAEHRMADVVHVDPDLVGPPGLQSDV